MRARKLPLLAVLCLLGAGCASESPTSPPIRPADDLLYGIGWVGAGGRTSDTTSTTSSTTAGIGWVGGGGRAVEDDGSGTAP